MTVVIKTGDCREVPGTLPDQSVHCCVTSPPYFGLRDYGHAGQIGLEATPDAFVAEMVAVFREVRRVLRDDGTLWLNLGDSYARDSGKGQHKPGDSGKQNYIIERGGGRCASAINLKHIGAHLSHCDQGEHIGSCKYGDDDLCPALTGKARLKPKDLIGIPWRVAFALQADGWYLRQDIIWSKPNPMPESVTDRCTKAHEYIFLMSKSARYHYDADEIRQKPSASSMESGPQEDKTGIERRRPNGMRTDEFVPGGNTCGVPDAGVNKRSVWSVATQPFSEAHFATFPPALIEPCILAGCPKGGTVIDPFGGAGTTGLVADRLGRDAILIELNPDYAAMARRRIEGDAGMFSSVKAETQDAV